MINPRMLDANVMINRANQRFENFDLKGDGKLTQLELAHGTGRDGRGQMILERFDLDNDGVITRAEHDQVIAEAAQRLRENQTRSGGGGGGLRPESSEESSRSSTKEVRATLQPHQVVAELTMPSKKLSAVRAYKAAITTARQ